MGFIAADKTGFIEVEGGKIWYRINYGNNDNASPLLVIHGGPGSTHDYLLPCLDLLEDRPIIFYDQLDSGRSERSDNEQNWILDRFSKEIDAIKQTLKINQIHILASSWGSAVAINYAAKKPDGLLSLSLSGALVNTNRWISDNEIWREQLPDKTKDILNHYESLGDYDNESYISAVQTFYEKHLCRSTPWPDYVQTSTDNTNLKLYRYMWGPTEFLATGLLRDLDLTPLLSNITTPTLFISGSFDEGTPDAARYFASKMPEARVAEIQNASHMPHIEQRQEFMNELRLFHKNLK